MRIETNLEGITLTELQAVCDRFEIDRITEVNLRFPHRLRQLLQIKLRNDVLEGNYNHVDVLQDRDRHYDEKAAIGDILQGKVKKSFDTNVVLGHSTYQDITYTLVVEEPSVDHLFDNKQLRSCSFHPEGYQMWEASMLITNPNVAFVHMIRDWNGEHRKVVGVSINYLADCNDFPQTVRSNGASINSSEDVPVLIVDDVEGYRGNLPRKWRRAFRMANERFAQHNGFEAILYSSIHGGEDMTAFRMSGDIPNMVEGKRVKIPVLIRGGVFRKYGADSLGGICLEYDSGLPHCEGFLYTI